MSLEVYSPVPMTEGENIIFGLSTKHLLHFVIGLAVSSPIMLLGAVLSPFLHINKLWVLVVGVAVGLIFAGFRVKDRPVAEYLWLSLRFSLRPKVIMFDREYRIRIHRERVQKKGDH